MSDSTPAEAESAREFAERLVRRMGYKAPRAVALHAGSLAPLVDTREAALRAEIDRVSTMYGEMTQAWTEANNRNVADRARIGELEGALRAIHEHTKGLEEGECRWEGFDPDDVQYVYDIARRALGTPKGEAKP